MPLKFLMIFELLVLFSKPRLGSLSGRLGQVSYLKSTIFSLGLRLMAALWSLGVGGLVGWMRYGFLLDLDLFFCL